MALVILYESGCFWREPLPLIGYVISTMSACWTVPSGNYLKSKRVQVGASEFFCDSLGTLH